MKILLIQVKEWGKGGNREEETKEDTKSRMVMSLRPETKCWDKEDIVAHAFNPALGETEAGVSLCV